jgi:N-acetylglutamate synthase-like GNAT family acetyltransferase
MSNIFFKIISYDSDEYKTSVLLREEILLKPLGLTHSEAVLEKEKDNNHIAGFKGNEIIATIVLSSKGVECKMKRVAVRTDMQYSGIGSEMVGFFEKYTRVQGFKAVYCNAKYSAIT